MAVSGIHEDSANPNSNSSHLRNPNPKEMYYIKGSIEAILPRCKFYFVNDGSTPALDGNTRNVILTRANTTAARGLRVIAMAYGFGSATPLTPPLGVAGSRTSSPAFGASVNGTTETSLSTTAVTGGDKTNLVFVGFQAMLDPPRKGVADSIGLLQAGGVHVVMITGDAEATALSIAQKLGMRVGRVGGTRGRREQGGGAEDQEHGQISNAHCLTGKAIDGMTKAQLKERVGNVTVFARTTPKHKMAIVEAFQARGKVVAMTGDGGEFFFLDTVFKVFDLF